MLDVLCWISPPQPDENFYCVNIWKKLFNTKLRTPGDHHLITDRAPIQNTSQSLAVETSRKQLPLMSHQDLGFWGVGFIIQLMYSVRDRLTHGLSSLGFHCMYYATQSI